MNGDVTLDGLDFDSVRAPATPVDETPTLFDLPLDDAATAFRPAVVQALAVEISVEVHLDFDSPMIFDSPVRTGWSETVGVFDLETTGIDTETARIVSAHVGVLDAEGTPIEGTSWLADPGVEIPAGATAVHGISTERARAEGRPAADVVAEILQALRSLAERGIPVVVYNAPYDLTLLLHEADRHDHRALRDELLVIDPLVLDKAVDRYRKGKRTLTAAAQYYGVELVDAHDSCADAVAAGRVAQALARRYPVELDVSPEQLHAMQVEWCREQTAGFVEYMRRVRDPHFTTSGEWPLRTARVPA